MRSKSRLAGSKARWAPKSACTSSDVADLAGRDHLPHVGHRRLEAGPHRLHAEDLGGAGRGDDLLGAGEGGGEGLLDQQRRARRRSRRGPARGAGGAASRRRRRRRRRRGRPRRRSAYVPEAPAPNRPANSAADSGERLPTKATSASRHQGEVGGEGGGHPAGRGDSPARGHGPDPRRRAAAPARGPATPPARWRPRRAPRSRGSTSRRATVRCARTSRRRRG